MVVKCMVTIIGHALRSNIVRSSAVFGFLVYILLANPMRGQTASPSVEGDYVGMLSQIHLLLHIHRDRDTMLTGILESIDQGAKGIPCTQITLSGTQFSFDVPAVQGAFKGEISSDGNTITGVWSQGSSMPLKFTRQALVPGLQKQTATKFSFEFAGKSRTYYLFIPDKSSPLPVVLLLHGSGRNGQVMVDAWSNLASIESFIVVAPDSSDSSGWGMKSDSPAFFHAVIEQVKARHAIDENRIYLFGHSAGAVHALVLAITDSHYYAATAVHAGALPPGYEKLLFSMAQRRMPIAIWVGDHDLLFSVDTVTATTRLFEENGFHVDLSVIPNHDHNYYAISDEVNSKAWDFLKKTQLGKSGAAIPH